MSEEAKKEAVQELIVKHQRQLQFFIFGIYPNHNAVEDILQETNKVIWAKRGEFEVGTNFLAWARTIAKFQTLSYLKSRNSKTWLHFDSQLVQDLARKSEERDSFLEGRKLHLSQCISSLPEKDQELVLRKYQLKETNKTISGETSRTEGGLKQAFMRIRRLLRECVERKEAATESQ